MSVAALLSFSSASRAQTLTVSGGLDLRAGAAVFPAFVPELDDGSLFVNLRAVLPDDEGDRIFLVAQVDVEQEIERAHLYNVYGQYKGPLGRWNVRVGRYLVPFGLHAYYDTERLLLAAHESEVLGVKLDEGVELLGFSDVVEYAVSVSRGFEDSGLGACRFGLQLEDLRLGVSYAGGRMPAFADEESVGIDELLPGARLIVKHRLALDYEHILGALTLRAEPIVGTDEHALVYGGYAEVGYLITGDLEILANGAYLDSWLVGTRWRAGAGIAFQLLPGVFLRAAAIYRDDFGEPEALVVGQAYGEFSHTLGGS